MSDLLTGQGCTLSPEPRIQDFPHEDVNEGPGFRTHPHGPGYLRVGAKGDRAAAGWDPIPGVVRVLLCVLWFLLGGKATPGFGCLCWPFLVPLTST